jgi:hypothetical protein
MVDATNRTGREQEDRATTQRAKRWEQPTGLPTPQPEEGYAFRWVRTALLGNLTLQIRLQNSVKVGNL